MDWSFLKNPILLAIIFGVITYLYMYYENEKKYKRNPKIERQSVSLITPGVVAILVWFITSSFFSGGNKVENSQGINPDIKQDIQLGGGEQPVNLIDNNAIKNVILSEGLTNSFDSKTYHLVGKNAIKLPQTDVFIDIAKF